MASVRWLLPLVLLAWTVGGAGCSTLDRAWPDPPFVPLIASVESLPALTTNALGTGRDAGNTARIDGRVIWLFGDTFIGSDELICATAAWSDSATPTNLHEDVDASGRPYQLYPFSADEVAFNLVHADPPACCRLYASCPQTDVYCRCAPGVDCASRIALWPGDVAIRRDGRAFGLYERVLAGVAPYDFTHLGAGLAVIPERGTVARRFADADGVPRMLFGRDEPNFLNAVVAPVDGVPHVYAYARRLRRSCLVDVLAARAPLGSMEHRESWRFFDGNGWSRDVDAAGPILSRVVGGLGSVAWNEYLDAYISGNNDICTGGSRFFIRTAPRPEGPWSEPAVVDLAPLGAGPEAYAGRLHPVFGDGRRIVISFYEPRVANDEVVGRVHLARVTFE
ncbi:MAG: DUF4185 domain-containing protein [Myxococcales bacterium]|nr:MAG: DUF4185 domain-containing protein [Myxococcales bacterium]